MFLKCVPGLDSLSPLSGSSRGRLLLSLSSRLEGDRPEGAALSSAGRDVTDFLVLNFGSVTRADRENLGLLLGHLGTALTGGKGQW